MSAGERHHVLDELLAESVARLEGTRSQPQQRPGARWQELAGEDQEIPEVRAPAPNRRAVQPPQDAGGGELQVGRPPVSVRRLTADPAGQLAELRTRLSRQRARNIRLQRELEAARERLQEREAELAQAADRERAQAEELAQLRRREQELAERLEEERLRRGRAELELERLKGRVAVLRPLLDGLARAGAELGLAEGGGERRAPGPPPSAEPADPAAKGGLVRVIADAVEHWRGPGPKPAR